jgi:hypothetical protein
MMGTCTSLLSFPLNVRRVSGVGTNESGRRNFKPLWLAGILDGFDEWMPSVAGIQALNISQAGRYGQHHTDKCRPSGRHLPGPPLLTRLDDADHGPGIDDPPKPAAVQSQSVE